MEITGWDTVLFTFTQPSAVFARVKRFVLERWPNALVEGIGEPTGTGRGALSALAEAELLAGVWHLIFYRDAEMARHMEAEAYVPMADGDGPFAVITRERRDVEFAVAELDEVRAADRTFGVPEPYRAWLCSPLVIEVTTVTPADPERHAFSVWVLEETKKACRMPV